MKKLICIIFIFCCAPIIKAQPNLILNGSFEQNIVTGCEMDEWPNHFNDSISYVTSYGEQMALLKDSCITCPPYYWGGESKWTLVCDSRCKTF